MEVKVMTDVLAQNDAIAASLSRTFKDKGIFVFNLMGSPGGGKTSLLEATLQQLAKEYRIAVIEGDLYTSKDAERIQALGVTVLQINTVGGCHLDAKMIQDALSHLSIDELDMIVIENVGNLVCPAEFDIGEAQKVTLLSVTEGEDKPLKYPLMFKESSAIIVNKIDLLPYVPFRMDDAMRDIRNLNPKATVFPISALCGDGLENWVEWIKVQIRETKANLLHD